MKSIFLFLGVKEGILEIRFRFLDYLGPAFAGKQLNRQEGIYELSLKVQIRS